MSYQINDKVHGFTVNRFRPLPLETGTLYEMTHDVTGATLIYVQTPAANKLFSAAFKTIPADDTGVFHILEHSVLSGSEKYPVKEPFVELLKSSMNTFLNALTFPDRTLYPVSSRNDKDFGNLVGVYLDAVFAPRAMVTPDIFYQEGWHYDLPENETIPTFKGVVYNEMKGAESSVDTVIRNQLKRMLYGETCYGFCSGGAVDHIPDLTYEEYCSMYRKYYHPTNAVFYLEGNMDADRTIGQIQSYLEKYSGEGPKFTIPYVETKPAASMVSYYDRGEEEEAGDKAHINYAKVWKTYEDVREIAAIELISDYLTGSNEAPLAKAVLASGLAEDFSIGIRDGIKQPYFQISVTNCSYEKREEIQKVIFDTFRELKEKGFNRHDMGASLNEMEFQFREQDEPKALYRNIRVLDSAIYGGDPMLYLDADDIFRFLRESLETDYYEKLAEQLFDLSDMQTLYTLPSATLGAERRKAEEKKLKQISEGWSEKEWDDVRELNRKLAKWQQTPDRPEDLAGIPKLSLADVDPEPLPHDMKVEMHRGVTVLKHGEGTPGIVYVNLYFPIPWRSRKILSKLTLLPSMLGTLSTGTRGPLEFQTDCQEHLGDLSYDIVCETKRDDKETTNVFFEVSASVLKHELPSALRLIKEVLKTTRFDEEDLIRQNLAQKVEAVRKGIISNGHSYALSYAAAADTTEAAVEESLHGLTAYRHIKKIAEHYDERKQELSDLFRMAQEELFVIPDQEEDTGVHLSITLGDEKDDVLDIDAWIDAFLGARSGKALEEKDLDVRRKDFPEKAVYVIPSGVSYAAMRANLKNLGSSYAPKWRILANILRFNYLWDQIRVQGGAYGTGARFSSDNLAGFHSYRDPNPVRSLGIYEGSGSFLHGYWKEQDNLESAIISTLAAMDPLLSASDIGDHYDSRYMRGITIEEIRDFRREMLTLKPEDLEECADALDKMKDSHRACVICHSDAAEKLKAMGYTLIGGDME